MNTQFNRSIHTANLNADQFARFEQMEAEAEEKVMDGKRDEEWLNNRLFEIVEEIEGESRVFTVTLDSPTFELDGIEFTVNGSRYNFTEFSVTIDGGYDVDSEGNAREMEENPAIKTFETAGEVSDDETEFIVTITLEELARAKEYRANYPVEIEEA